MSVRPDLRPRDLAVLRVLAENGRETSMGLPPGRVWHLAFADDEPYRQRRDAGMTRTLDRLRNLGLVRGSYEWGGTGRYWTITAAGREALT
jgi:hypothetical protein